MTSHQAGRTLLALMLGAFAVFVFLLMDSPPSKGWTPTGVVIPKGSRFPDVMRILTSKKLVQHPVALRLLVLGTMTGGRLRYGEYTFPEPPSTVEVWRKICSGDVARHPVTVPEGSNLYDIAEILADEGLASPDAFIAKASATVLLEKLGIPGESVEGFLFPDTYLLERSMSPEDIIELMVRQFRRKFPRDWEKKGEEDGFSLLQVVTIASIIEKETGVEEEKPLVSAIIRRRLALRMPLQMDPTVIYGLKRFGVELTRKDLQTPNPYNTYTSRGLPPGPISNPGLSAIRAALFPAESEYLYFVSRNDGSHLFSRTLEEHNRGVAAYRRGETITD